MNLQHCIRDVGCHYLQTHLFYPDHTLLRTLQLALQMADHHSTALSFTDARSDIVHPMFSLTLHSPFMAFAYPNFSYIRSLC
jgi:hypothetical protein